MAGLDRGPRRDVRDDLLGAGLRVLAIRGAAEVAAHGLGRRDDGGRALALLVLGAVTGETAGFDPSAP